jgi:hypothetical protein
MRYREQFATSPACPCKAPRCRAPAEQFLGNDAEHRARLVSQRSACGAKANWSLWRLAAAFWMTQSVAESRWVRRTYGILDDARLVGHYSSEPPHERAAVISELRRWRLARLVPRRRDRHRRLCGRVLATPRTRPPTPRGDGGPVAPDRCASLTGAGSASQEHRAARDIPTCKASARLHP